MIFRNYKSAVSQFCATARKCALGQLAREVWPILKVFVNNIFQNKKIKPRNERNGKKTKCQM
jgi:hypothetical protein